MFDYNALPFSSMLPAVSLPQLLGDYLSPSDPNYAAVARQNIELLLQQVSPGSSSLAYQGDITAYQRAAQSIAAYQQEFGMGPPAPMRFITPSPTGPTDASVAATTAAQTAQFQAGGAATLNGLNPLALLAAAALAWRR